MRKYVGIRYGSMMDASAWGILLSVCAVCIVPVVIAPELWMIILMSAILLFILLTFIGIYYRIDGNNLVVYQFFIPTAYPIDKIAEVKPTKSILSSPATSLTHRLAIKFSDKTVLRSTMPLIISPVRQKEFIDRLVSTNPAIKFVYPE